ncbi:MAG: LysR family transcriptional regulator substrate-binding protein [Chloroflexota bacterium]
MPGRPGAASGSAPGIRSTRGCPTCSPRSTQPTLPSRSLSARSTPTGCSTSSGPERLDVALPVLRPGLDLEEIELLPYIEEPFVLAAPPGSSLAGVIAADLADVAGEPLVTFNPGSSLRRLVEQAFAAAGLEPRVALETIETGAARAMVSSGLGVAILPRSVATRPGPPVAVVPLVSPPVRRSAIAWRTGTGSPARDRFLAAASQWRRPGDRADFG